MNKEQFEGSWQEFKGEIKKKWGQLTDNDLLEAEGDYDKFLGVVQKRYGDKKDEVERWAEDWHERNEILARKASESPNQCNFESKPSWLQIPLVTARKTEGLDGHRHPLLRLIDRLQISDPRFLASDDLLDHRSGRVD